MLKCSMGLYPFMFGSIQDFEPVAEKLIKVSKLIMAFPSTPCPF
jgi:hypothetical protein